MDKVESLGEVSGWADLNRDILELIFNKLEVMDITMGASRVCISWFLASHKKTLWNTVDLTSLQELDVSRSFNFKDEEKPIFFYKHRVDDDEGLTNLLTKFISWFFLDLYEVESGIIGISLMNLLIEITKLSRMTPKNLFFNFNSYIQENGLKFAAETMPNIEKLALPIWCYQTEKSLRFAFSQWKNLKTLIIAHEHSFTGIFDFKAVGESCSNLTNLKYLGHLEEYKTREIVPYLQSLKRLSLRCSLVSYEAVYCLIIGLQNLTMLNVSHCKNSYFHAITRSRDDFVITTATQKLENFILCPQDCRICKDHQCCYSWSYHAEDWRNDEIKELAF
ncbi:putative F-box protein At4g11580 [Arabidopsis lyrata subsp. lyrata]|uniref:putative F-box protein At4g11580 n=1 Tax=Arabidopsis lyrata subsp. lyrata TaxID=81972 RepID=UPI000A29AED1|nr:putative F-box protein At4g11580 [Arabidopsis lyrata subsp. lyrata]|eukprot:XP_020879532.1 putative F-box protein At4g11580 [Arabidopsis lyrata subsp. lyrata]